MNILLSAETETLLVSIIENEEWLLCPKESYFYETLRKIEQYSEDAYKSFMKDLISDLKKYEFEDVRDYINQLIKVI
ncbi:MAG: hypothetical protein Q4F97_12700 [Bacteroidales bacterium]|nr:hypothetical protein [Bacteroidales bacterium]